VKVVYPPEVEDSEVAVLAMAKAVDITGLSGELEVTLVALVQPEASVTAELFVIVFISPEPEPDEPEAAIVNTDGVNAELDIYLTS
jgi:hypothetical protein